MWIATYANARTALEARKGIAPAFMAGACPPPWGGRRCTHAHACMHTCRVMQAPPDLLALRASGFPLLRGSRGAEPPRRANTKLPAFGVPPHVPAAFRSGAVMGFLLAGNALLVLFLLLLVLRKVYGDDWEGLYEVRAALTFLHSTKESVEHLENRVGVAQRSAPNSLLSAPNGSAASPGARAVCVLLAPAAASQRCPGAGAASAARGILHRSVPDFCFCLAGF